MAIVFEVNVVCSRLVDLDCLFHKTDIRSLGIEIGKISSMDNWFWENRTTNSNMRKNSMQAKLLTSNLSRMLQIVVVFLLKCITVCTCIAFG